MAHITTHTRDKHYLCEACGKSFTQISSLKIHKHIHSRNRHYVCDTCNKDFTNIGHLKRHQRVHTGAKMKKKKVCQYLKPKPKTE